MFQSNVRNDGNFRAVDDIGGVQLAAHADFQNYNITLLFTVILHGDGCNQFKLAGMIFHRVRYVPHLFRNPGEVFSGDILSVQLNALTEILNVGRGIEPGPVPSLPQNGIQHGAGRAFPVASGDMNKLQLLLWISKGMQ